MSATLPSSPNSSLDQTKGDGFKLRLLAGLLSHGLVHPTDGVVGHGDVGGRCSCDTLGTHDSPPKSTTVIYASSAVRQTNSVSTSGLTTWTSFASTSTTDPP
ncbi:hypothetical protein ECG_06104 [Echinococcus granulosus]|uniref:Uncharacterized protein n=1 Tax=Echinococcus granulosus TaxID=6210 RepID=A0A068WYC5_ECHGR|nr:hypothetical protein ECG_06104 [Echinococcus granulosus]CDS25164.1 hypothetical protein EgrG_002064600 [Echinococcus granulosus]